MSYSALDCYMKSYEMVDAGVTLHPGLPVCIRLDGKGFHNVTRNCERPFDQKLRRIMEYTTLDVLTECGAAVGYTQSDEISLVLPPVCDLNDMYFGGRVQKLCSILASVASVSFNKSVRDLRMDSITMPGYFDCRCWSVPTLDFAADVIMWRQQDAVKNSISMAAQSKFSHAKLLGKSGKDKILMLKDVGVDYYSYRAEDRNGVLVRKHRVNRKFTPEEISVLPPKHEARKNPDLVVDRVVIAAEAAPYLGSLENKKEYLFDYADPVFRKEASEMG